MTIKAEKLREFIITVKNLVNYLDLCEQDKVQPIAAQLYALDIKQALAELEGEDKQQITAVSSNGKTSDSKSENESSILSAVATELEKAADEYGRGHYCENVNPEEAFIKGAKWLAERLRQEFTYSKEVYKYQSLDLALEDLTKTSEGK